MKNRDKILEKLRKLMNLEASARDLGNEGEANAAAAGISRLLAEYNLSLDDIPDEEKPENPVVSERIPYKAELSDGPWYRGLVEIVCRYNFCKALVVFCCRPDTGRRRRDAFEIVGRKKNVEVVMYLISYLAHRFVTAGRRKYPAYKHRCSRFLGAVPASRARYMKSFLVGCVVGLDRKLEESAGTPGLKEKVTALAVNTAAEIDGFLEGRRIGRARNSAVLVDGLAASDGVSAGYGVEIHKGIRQDSTSGDRMLE